MTSRSGEGLTPPTPLQIQQRMVDTLLHSLRSQGVPAELIETHISFVLLAGEFVYKLKKAVKLAFLDFSTLALRRHFCDEELRLNRRFAPDLYLDVIDITGAVDSPGLGGGGPVLEHAVRMRAFPQRALWDGLVPQGGVLPRHIDALAGQLVSFHETASVSGDDTGFGLAPRVRAPMRDNFVALDALPVETGLRSLCDELRRWEAIQYATLASTFDVRQRAGRVRECHGDLHLGNLTMIDDRPVMFDALEFDPALSWTDVMSDLAFVSMDLQQHGRADLAHRMVNAYFERSGDYPGARVLRYYQVHRSLVRAKVAALRCSQAPQAKGPEAIAERQMRSYLALAQRLSRPGPPVLFVTHGFSGSGKSHHSQDLLESWGAIRVRADVERKRLHGLEAAQRSESSLDAGLYSADATRQTYARLEQVAAEVIGAGHSVILDASFLRRAQRDSARARAKALGAVFVLIDFRATESTLRERVQARSSRGEDASEADLTVLAHQLSSHEPMQPDELAPVFVFDTEAQTVPQAAAARWAPLVERLRSAPRVCEGSAGGHLQPGRRT